MNGAVELPGSASPLTPQEVLRALQSAGSNQQQAIHEGTKQLQTWEDQPGYYSLLQAAFLDKSLPTEIRYLAILQLKNGIDKYWRKTSSRGISMDEKATIRARLLESGITEADNGLALQVSLVIAKVVRIDHPKEWPEAINDLLAQLRLLADGNQLHLKRALLILLQIVKELATARLRHSQTTLQSNTSELVFVLSHIYSQKAKQWAAFLQGEGGSEGEAIQAMENSLAALKTLRRLFVAGYEYPHKHPEAKELWAEYQSQFGFFLGLVNRQPPVLTSPAKELVEKHLFQFAKLHVSVATVHPASFAHFPNTIPLVRAYWSLASDYANAYAAGSTPASGSQDERSVIERLSLKGLVILRYCIKMVHSPNQTFRYRTPEIKEEQSAAKKLMKTELLTPDLVQDMANVIVSKFFVFRKEDMEAWEEAPEEWENKLEGGADTWEFDIRPCSEKLFVDLVLNYKEILVQPLLAFFQSVTGTDNDNVLLKDPVYAAMGLSAPVVFQAFDFDAFLSSTLVKDVQLIGPQYRPLRRRVAILISQWVTVKISEEHRSLVYQVFQYLLNPQDPTNDLVVRLSAALQFKQVVDDYNFTAENFTPFASTVLGHLVTLIQEVEATETRMAVLDTIRVIAIRVDRGMGPFADDLVAICPGLWEASGEEHLMKQAILTLLSTLVTATREQSQRYHSLILPLIQRAVEPGSEMQVYCLEEALELWKSILAHSPQPPSPSTVALAESAFPLIEFASDNLRTVLEIVESYVFLAPEAMLTDAARQRLISYMSASLGRTRREFAGFQASIVEQLLRSAETFGGVQGITQVVKDLNDAGYLEKVFGGLRDAYEAHQTTGPNRRYPKIDDVFETDHFTILARILLGSPETFIQLLSSIGPLDHTFDWLTNEWFRHFDSMANVERQKLSCLALTRLLELPSPVQDLVLVRLQDFISMWTTVVGEMSDGREDGGDNLVWADAEDEQGEWETPEDVRKRAVAASDPVHKVHTFEFIKERLAAVVQAVGGEQVFKERWAANVDKDVMTGFQQLYTGKRSSP